jgi:hypothetical protein
MSVTLRENVAGGTHYRLSTAHGPVHVWIPASGGGDGVVVYVHGYYDTADSAWSKYALGNQFAASGQNAIFIVPEAPAGSSDPVSWSDLSQLLAAVEGELGARLPGDVTAMGHSGAYRTILGWLSNPRVKHVTLLDALYAGVPNFVTWGNMPGHTMDIVTTPAGGTLANASVAVSALQDLARRSSLPLDSQALAAKNVYVASNLAHMALVTPPTSLIPEFLRRASSGGLGMGAVLALALVGLAFWASRS